jgi:hypothetical protein
MSVQPPPTNTTSPVYNSIFYVNPTASSGIDVAFLDANYLKFPTAQGSEDFTNGLFSTNTIDFNSATGTDRAITNVSKTEFSDILGNTSYTASIEENSTAIGIYDGGLIINSSNSINLVGTSILANGLPLGGGNVSNNQSNTFLLGTTQTFAGTISIDNAQSNIGQLPNNNTALGNATLGNIVGGTSNTAFGYASLSSSISDINNTAVGLWSGKQLLGDGTDSNNNTFVGYESGYNQITGSGNVAVGYQTGVGVSFSTLDNTIAIGNGVSSVATGDMILGFTNFTPPYDYWVKFTPNNTFGGVQLQGSYNNSGNFTISAINQSVVLEGTFIDLNGTNTGAIGSVNVSNGMNINTGVIQSIDQGISNPTFQSLYSCYYSLSGVPYFGYNNGTYTYSQLATTSSLSGYALLASPNTFTGTNEFQSPINLNNTSINFQGDASLIMGNTTSVVDFPEPLPVVPSSKTGLGIAYDNAVGITGEVDFLCYGDTGNGGFAFYNMTSTTTPTQLATIYPTTSSFSSNPTIPTSSTIGTLTASPTATTYWVNNLYAPISNPALTGVPTAPTADLGTNTTQLATTAFVQNAITSTSIQVVSIVSSEGASRATIGQGTGTYWIVVPSPAQPISSNPTPPFGYSFNYSIYTNITPSTQDINSNDTLSIQGNYTTSIGTGAAQPFNQIGTGTFWGYVLGAQIVTQGGLSDLYCAFNSPVTGNNFWYFFTASTDSSLIGTTLTMNIYVA